MKGFRHKVYIHVDTCIYKSDSLYFGTKPVIILKHAIQQSYVRNITYPDQLREVIRTGNVKRFGRRGLKFIKRSENGSIICIGEDVGCAVIIKTVERGN